MIRQPHRTRYPNSKAGSRKRTGSDCHGRISGWLTPVMRLRCWLWRIRRRRRLCRVYTGAGCGGGGGGERLHAAKNAVAITTMIPLATETNDFLCSLSHIPIGEDWLPTLLSLDTLRPYPAKQKTYSST